jgi:hypothetical protein
MVECCLLITRATPEVGHGVNMPQADKTLGNLSSKGARCNRLFLTRGANERIRSAGEVLHVALMPAVDRDQGTVISRCGFDAGIEFSAGLSRLELNSRLRDSISQMARFKPDAASGDYYRMIGSTDPSDASWQSVDLRTVWQHELRVPLVWHMDNRCRGFYHTHRLVGRWDLVQIDPAVADGPTPDTPDPDFASVLDLMEKSAPPITALVRLKDFGLVQAYSPQSFLPREIGTMLYYLAVALALVRLDRRITSDDDSALREGFRWCLRQVWLDGASAAVIRSGLEWHAGGQFG